MNDELREAVRSTCETADRHADRCDADAVFPEAALDEMRRTGLLGLLVPTCYGGHGGDLDDLVDASTALGRVDLSVALIFAMHCQQAAVLVRYADERLRAEVLPMIAKGEVYLGSVTTSPGTGGHLMSSDSTAGRAGDDIVIDREAPIATGARHADAFLVTMGTPNATSPTQVDLVYAARDQLQVEITGGWRPLGMRATESVPMRLRGTVPAWQIVGAPGRFRDIATECFAPVAHIGWSAAWLGTAVGAHSRVLHHIRTPSGRRQFDPSSELLLARLATGRARLEVVHALLRHTVAVLTTATDPHATRVQLLTNTLKIVSAEECCRAVDDLIDLIGLRHGYLTDSPLRLERSLRDLRSASLNYANDRLRRSNGALTLLDTAVDFACPTGEPGPS